MNIIDVSIILIYIVMSVGIGIWISRKASKGLDDYFLGGKSIKWYFLGLSNGSGMFDVSGTSWMIGVLFLYGVKSFMFMWLWPIWNQIFVMMFLAVWIRRSKVMTGSEWILTRFGSDKAGKASHIIVAIFAIISTIGFIAYFFVGIGKFVTIILPWDLTVHMNGSVFLTSEQAYALLIIFLTTIYTVKGGMFSVVATEVVQYIIMIVAGVLIAGYAFINYTDIQINSVITPEWKNVFFGWEFETQWSDKFETFNRLIDTEGYKMFGAFIGMTLFKGFFASVAGPTPSYDLQRVLSTKSVKEAAYMSGFTNLILFIPRYLLITGIVVIALVNLAPELNANVNLTGADLELLMPKVVNLYIPVGIKGILLAGLLAAFMSGFSAFVNAGPAYIVNDIYKKYFKPVASNQHYIKVSQISSFLVVGLGVFMGFFADSINSLTLWITSALYGGYVAANFLKWIWWRFNGWGYFWGMVGGLIAASLQFVLDQNKGNLAAGTFLHDLSQVPSIYLFPLIFGMSILGCLLGTYLSKPTDIEVLKSFYTNVRPWGFWTPVYKQLKAEDQSFQKNNDFYLDMMNCVIGIIWQSSMILLPIYFIIRDYPKAGVALVVFLVTTTVLKFTWLDRVRKIEE
ncbi:sodium:solute symporter family protein [Flavobacterium notoginsengisoli]|uniref:sodium:solute symporter family protein n=1 Tax=Flavobacterium notoginsengisoli TaxID=1478199 RepID=UPI0036303DBA